MGQTDAIVFCPRCTNRLALTTVDGRDRLCCPSESCGYVHWDNPVPVVAALVVVDGMVALVRNKSWPSGMFGLVTGFLERGETPQAAVLREVEEELGLRGTLAGFVGCYSFFEMNQLILAFHVEASGTPVLGDELVEYRLVPPDRLRPWPFGTGLAVKDWLEGRNA
ncbi:MAG TPA: NUDIX domain-containing protein [Deltaproteobacteria bacterium]|nr:NUDIX domain-containing protein [Deltaproteobacteria bacterium]